MRDVYLIDVGVLLPKDHPEYKSYVAYDCKYGFYDEDQYYVSDLEEAKEQAREYVEKGVENTYAVISITIIDDGIDLSDCPVQNETYKQEDVVYSLCKQNGELVENFVA